MSAPQQPTDIASTDTASTDTAVSDGDGPVIASTRDIASTDIASTDIASTDIASTDTASTDTASTDTAVSDETAPGTVLTPAASGVGDPDLAVDDALSVDAVVEPVADGTDGTDEDDEDDGDERDEDEDDDGADLLVREGDVAGDYLERLLDILDKDGDIDLDVEGDRASVAIVGGKLTDLIGPDGATLEALQELTRLAVAQSTGVRSRLMLDIGEFRARRRADLTALAGDAARRVASSGQPERMAPMNPFERKVVHDVIASVPGVHSESEGEEPNRRVVILPDK